MAKVTPTSSRKSDHIRINLEEPVSSGLSTGLEDYYFERARLIWPLGALAVIVGTLFRPVAFGNPLWTIDNLSGVAVLVVCAILTLTRNRVTHRILVPVVLASVLWDTLRFSHSIG